MLVSFSGLLNLPPELELVRPEKLQSKSDPSDRQNAATLGEHLTLGANRVCFTSQCGLFDLPRLREL